MRCAAICPVNNYKRQPSRCEKEARKGFDTCAHHRNKAHGFDNVMTGKELRLPQDSMIEAGRRIAARNRRMARQDIRRCVEV